MIAELHYTADGVFERVTKTRAKKEYEKGKTIAIVSSLIRFDSMWVSPYIFNAAIEPNFEKICNSYIYYNCNNETGKQLKYYIVTKN